MAAFPMHSVVGCLHWRALRFLLSGFLLLCSGVRHEHGPEGNAATTLSTASIIGESIAANGRLDFTRTFAAESAAVNRSTSQVEELAKVAHSRQEANHQAHDNSARAKSLLQTGVASSSKSSYVFLVVLMAVTAMFSAIACVVCVLRRSGSRANRADGSAVDQDEAGIVEWNATKQLMKKASEAKWKAAKTKFKSLTLDEQQRIKAPVRSAKTSYERATSSSYEEAFHHRGEQESVSSCEETFHQTGTTASLESVEESFDQTGSKGSMGKFYVEESDDNSSEEDMGRISSLLQKRFGPPENK